MKSYTINFDGACNPTNPGGYMGYGYIVKEDREVLIEGSGFDKPAPTNTNNVAEYKACIDALEFLYFHIKDNNITDYKILVMGDSSMVVNQMNGRWKIKSGHYKESGLQCQELVNSKFKGNIKFKWIPREENMEADALSVESLEAIGRVRTK